MIKRFFSLFISLSLITLFSGCILSTTPEENTVSMEIGNSITFQIQRFPAGSDIQWHLDGDMIPGSTDISYQYLPYESDIGDHILTVVESSVIFGTYTHEWSISVESNGVMNSRQQVQDLLFAAYAGIGYMDADVFTDEENLYRVMVGDLNEVTGNLILDTLSGDPQYMTKLLGLILGSETTLNYTDTNGNECSLYLDPGPLGLLTGRRPFSAILAVNFSSTGYTFGDCIYTGEAERDDLVGTFTGYFKAILQAPYLDEFFIKSIELEAKDSLRSTYPFGIVRYNGWKLSCDIYYGQYDPEYEPGDLLTPINVVFDPINWSGFEYDGDFRYYSVGGDFSLDGETYTFSDGFHYRQKDNGSLTMLFIDGDLMVPGTYGFVTMDTTDDYLTDPVANGVIIRNSSGIWTSGMMTLIADNEVGIDIANGTAEFYGDLGAWSVAGWQDTLEPF